jgi:hypothetical protein
VSEKLLRPAGYSLSQRLDDLNSDYMGWLFAAYLCSIASVGVLSVTPTDAPGQLLFLGTFGTAAAGFTVGAWRKWADAQKVRLGLLGEQALAEQLRLLGSKGYQVFHDVPGSGKWNVDHVAVGPGGVFVIETKARMKRPGPKGSDDYRVRFDGRLLRFPNGVDKKAAQQAKANAKWVAELLSKATGEPVRTIAIVALPGWLVDRERTDFDVLVLSGKEVPGFIADKGRTLSDAQIERIVFQLDQRCRDVGF